MASERDPDEPELDSTPASSGEASHDDDRATEEGRAEASVSAAPTPAPDASVDPPRSRRLLLSGAVLVVLLALDLVTKQWAWDNLREGAIRIVMDGWVYFEFGFNTGSAFSLLRDASWSRLLFIGITFLALFYMGHLARTLPTRFTSAYVAIGMVASGALGNLHDRFVRTMIIDGVERYGVVDFIKVYYWRGKPWPTFNVADVALVAGVALLLLFLLRHGDVLDEQAERAKQAKAAPT
ncbi:signal peptidase II [Paraliomyxa miuraensis]|uniref:signal peptidase II n=1 Tax=Paraliomyxa miuraensis TaxID=376150 RepID=UPI00225ABE5C|nr:signal peptidase II [Paraliomyxa miuraensis]MCX4245468.1 signal peptidase II [Paraliomyxa miuraensis]